MKKVGVLYICTGDYTIFRKDFYKSVEENFLPGYEKHYFVFTDAPNIQFEDENTHIHRFYQQNLGRPYNTLMRFQIFLTQEKALSEMDFLFFMNANLQILEKITDEDILPTKEEGLTVCLHPGFYKSTNNKFFYDRNPLSTAFIPVGSGHVYVAGGLNGGYADAFLRMCHSLNYNIQRDLETGIIAKRHDESHLNKYILSHPHRLIGPGYLFFEDWNLPFKARILVREKSKLLDILHIKQNKSMVNRLKSLIIPYYRKYFKQ